MKSAAKALAYAGEKIPEKRHKELTEFVQIFYNVSELSKEMILEAANMETRKENCDFVSHGEEVVKKLRAEGKLLKFEKLWRQKFVENMSPQFLPPMWSVDHRHQKLKGMLECLETL